MEDILTVITIISFIAGLIVSGNVLNSKSDLERVFLTHEQMIKTYFYNLIMLSGIIAFIGSNIFITWKVFTEKGKTTIGMNELSTAFGFAIVIFICSLISLGTIIRLIQNFFFKHHYKYKVNFPDIGEVYILSMMNKEICICSKDPNANMKISNEASFLIKLDTVLEQPLIKKKILKPQKTFIQKLFFE